MKNLICLFICFGFCKVLFAQTKDITPKSRINFSGGTISNINDYFLSKRAGWISFGVEKKISSKFYVGVKAQSIRYFELSDLKTESYGILNEETDLGVHLKITSNENKRFVATASFGIGLVNSEYTNLTDSFLPASSLHIRELQLGLDPSVELRKSVSKTFQILLTGGMKIYPQNFFDHVITSTVMGSVNWIPYYGLGFSINL